MGTTKLRHAPTGVTVEMGAVDLDGTAVEEIGFQSKNIIVQRKRFTNDKRGSDFTAEDIHLHTMKGSVEVVHLPSGTMCIVKLSDFEKVFIDMEMANAIADAINADKEATVAV